MIHRVIHNKDNPYFQLNRTVLEDTRLSWKAACILVYLLSKPDNWVVRERDLINKHTDGRDAVRSGLLELREAGYIKKVWIREHGKFSRMEAHVFECPQVDDCVEWQEGDDRLEDESPWTENPSTENPVDGKSGLIVKTEGVVKNDGSEFIAQNTGIQGRCPPSLFDEGKVKPPGKVRQMANRLFTVLRQKNIIYSNQKVDLLLWEKHIKQHITKNEVDLDEFELRLYWWCDHLGELYVTGKIESASGFCKRYMDVRESYRNWCLNQEKKSHNGHSGNNPPPAETTTVRKSEKVMTDEEYLTKMREI